MVKDDPRSYNWALDAHCEGGNKVHIIDMGIMLYLLIIILILLVVHVCRWKNKRKHIYELAANIPQPENISCFPLIGHATYFMGNPQLMLNKMLQLSQKPGPFALWFGPKLTIIINRPEDFQIVLHSQNAIGKNGFYSFFDEIIGHGLLNAPVKKWKQHKKIIQPTFNQKTLDAFVPTLAKLANDVVDALNCHVGETIEMYNFTAPYALNGVSETLLGVDLEVATGKKSLHNLIGRLEDTFDIKASIKSYTTLIYRMQEITMYRYGFLPYYSNFIFKSTTLGSELYSLINDFHRCITKIITQSKKIKKSEGHLITPRENVLLQELLEMSENGKQISEKEVFDEIATFLIGGSDTTATLTCFVLIMLALHKNVEQKLYEEIIEVMGTDRDIDYMDLPRLKYLEQIIFETDRLFTIVPNAFRKVNADIKLDTCIIPKGANLLLAFQAMHRSPLYFKDPLKFNPDRFNPEEIKKINKYAFLPFSAGPRNCIGFKYATMSLKTILATTVRKYRFDTTYSCIEDIDTCQDIFLRAIKGYTLKVIARN